MEPCKQMTRFASTATVSDAVEKAERRIQKWSASLSKVPGLRSADRCLPLVFLLRVWVLRCQVVLVVSSFCATAFVPVVVLH
jgi:hypothetical protein